MREDVYPIFLHNLSDATVVVVGGGKVGERKVKGLLAVGATVRLISPQATAQLQELAAEQQIEWIARAYRAGDLGEAMLAFAATNQRAVNHQVFVDAKAQRILCNVADCAAEGDFHLPALHREGGLTVAVGSHGRDIHAAKHLRDRIVDSVRAELICSSKEETYAD